MAIVLTVSLSNCKSKKINPSSTNSDENAVSEAAQKQIKFDYDFVSGCSERMKGNLQEALKLFIECRNIDPDNAAVHYELGMLYRLLSLNDLALKEAKLCASAEAKNEWYQLLLIDCYSANKLYQQAVKTREHLVKNFPERNDFKQDLAYEYAMTGQYDKAFKIYDDLEKTYGVNEQLTLNKLKLLKSLKRPQEAEAELQKLIASDPKEPRYYSYLAEFYMENNQIEMAKGVYDTLIALDPNNPAINLALHDYYSAKGEETRAFECLKKAFENPELDVKTKTSILSSIFEQSNQNASNKEQGKELTLILIKLYPESPEVNSIQANYLMMDHKMIEAAQYYYMAAVHEKNNFRVWEDLILIDNELNHLDSLEKHSDLAMELFPSQAILYYYNGYANMQLKNYPKAVKALKDGINFVIDDKALLLRFYASLGDACFYAGDFTCSFKSYDDALKIDPDNTYVLNNYAYFLSLQKKDLEKAAKYSKRTLDLKPNEKNYMDTYGWILFQQKNYPEAEEWLSKAVKLGPNNANILEHYGDALYMNNKPDKALEQWKAAKEQGKPSEGLLEKIKSKKLND